MTRITGILAREVLDSRGNPTVEAEVRLAGGARGRAIVPAGASTGAAEARELRDTNVARYDGQGVAAAVRNVREVIARALIGFDAADQRAIDARLIELDGTPLKTALGANALLAVSLAAAHAAAAARGVPLFRHLAELFRAVDPVAPEPRVPMPMINMISGGLHAGGNLDFQDFLIMPVGADSLAAALEWSARVYRRLGQLLSAAGYEGRLVGDEGGYGPRLPSNEAAAEFVVAAIEAAGLDAGHDVVLAIDVAATHFYDGQCYRLSATNAAQLTSDEMIDRLAALVERYPVASLEDPLAEEDWTGWQAITERLGRRVRLIGDDLFATDPRRLRQGIDRRAANAVLVKLNQIGTLSETLETVALARQAGYAYIISARSGETEDTTIADLAVATAADSIKIGSLARSERLGKYNQLLRIAEELASES